MTGSLEHTLLKAHMRGANLRRWLKRPECPEIMRQFKHLFDKTFSSSASQEIADSDSLRSRTDVAHYRHDGIVFSRASTHLGNSLVLYYPSPSATKPIVGSIQKIDVLSTDVHLFIRRQLPLPPGKYDPFHRYPLFPATVYSSAMDDGPLDSVPLSYVVSHVARYNFSSDRAIVLNLSRVCLLVFANFYCS